MPYIPDKEKYEMHDAINDLEMFITTKGDLNYAICELVGRLILNGKISYTKMSEWIDGVHDAEGELRRRLLDKYEDKKIYDNGDVPSFISILEILEYDR
jgi:predicted translin family RNA/ssDNA-binding protein